MRRQLRPDPPAGGRHTGGRTAGCHLLAGVLAAFAALAVGALSIPPAGAADWPHWRGPQRDGTSAETGLPESWSTAGENLLWRRDFTGRSTPVVVNGRVCATGRVGEEISRQETAACWDAETGELLWQKRWNVYHTTVPWNRVGWANPTADPETGYLYVQGVGGLFFCFDSADGRVVWSKKLVEELGFMEGYGGRTQTPLVDEDRLIVHFASTNWGDQSRPLHRMYAFDKRTGEPLWMSSPASSMADKNTQSTPAVAVIDGRRLVIAGNGGGWIYAVEARTGEPVWGFELSKRGINTSVVVDGETVYAAHSEENVDEPTMGRVVAIDATGEGDVTKTHERWRLPLGVGFASPALDRDADGGVLYLVDNGADLHAVDADTGEELWHHNLGTVGKAAPVVADGKIYATEVNGRFVILRPGEDGVASLDVEEVSMPDGRYAEIYGSPAIADGRVYFTTEEGIYCLADADAEGGADSASDGADAYSPGPETPAPADAAVATVLAIPAEVRVAPGGSVSLRAEAFDAEGRALGERRAKWTLDGLAGTLSPDGSFTADPGRPYQAGTVVAEVGGVTGVARVRVVPEPPIADDLEGWAVDDTPTYLFSYLAPWKVGELDGEKVIVKSPSARKLNRHHTLIGPLPELSGYTVQADVRGTRTGRRLPDIGLINSGYILDLMGAHQQIQVRSWAAALRMAQQFPFAWEPDTWYTMKMRVDHGDGEAVIRGKVWPREQPEPEAWTVTVEDPYPIAAGSPGLIAYSPTPLYYDNLAVTANQ